MKIAIIDGQGGGIGKVLVEKIRREFEDDVELLALGTNCAATTLMLKAGADEGATGENSIVYVSNQVDIIIGSLGIVIPNAMLGEVTPKMAEAVSLSPALKLLLPLLRGNIVIAGSRPEPLPHLVAEIINRLHGLVNRKGK